MTKPQKRPRPGKPPTHPKVLVWETGEVFDTFTEAGDSVGCTRWGVMRCCEGVQDHSHGFHFMYTEIDLERMIDLW